ncbi:general substrate transporter [Cryphonectria parasitica EP155]|uniref:General substrate transporter n=1 Tax=Cryphonectria parasitica (strain ATCC 38755 / EP155) TaxID=660469 RepID=A0A9P4XWB9_CRYP1|nr:general substrate transporter [Cryphonectria parasitica EP155]KAF3762041.1 general substrate transporter [Cryphonectria parasitica EP155]
MKILYIALFASFGGLLYGYQQGVLGQALVMNSFQRSFPSIAADPTAQGWLTSVLQLGGWLGAVSSGVFCEVFSRKRTIFSGAIWVILGSYLTAGANAAGFLYAGRFFTGIGVGTLSAAGPLYNAELAPPELRGLLVSMQQLATTIGILAAYWIAYGTNYTGGTGDGQSDWAWRLPLIIQGVPAIVLAVGVWFLPYSPRWLVGHNRKEDALQTLSRLRGAPIDDQLIQIEYLDIQSECIFERRMFEKRFPNLSEKWRNNIWFRELAQYGQIVRTKDSFKRVAIASLVMFFQQFSGIDSVIYYAPIIFTSLGLTSSTSSLLATGITGVINVCTTIPAVLVIDKIGRKTLLMFGSFGMLSTLVIVGVIASQFQNDWPSHAAGGWACVVMIWLYIVNFAYSWGPASWTLIAEIFPLSIRAKGTSIGASANWMCNFVIALMTPSMLARISWGLYIFFAGWLALGIVFVWFFVPETKGKTLEEMDQVFGSKSSEEDIEVLAAIQEEVGLLRAIALLGEQTETEGKMSTQHVDQVA